MKWIKKVFDWFAADFKNDESKETATKIIVEKEVTPPTAPKRIKIDGVFEIIIMSDNHGNSMAVSQIFTYHHEADYYLHCGDINFPPEKQWQKPMTVVKGNTDYGTDYPDHEHLELPTGEKIWMTHGHLEMVGVLPEKIFKEARKFPEEKIPNIILYGHLHKVDVRMHEEFLIINPGSVIDPRDGIIRTYAKLTVSKEAYKVDIYNCTNNKIIKEFEFQRATDVADQTPE